jgi:hypothetical protein
MHSHLHAVQGNLQTGSTNVQLNRTADVQRAAEVRRKLAASALAIEGERGDPVTGSEAVGEREGRQRGSQGREARAARDAEDPVEPISFWA